MTFRNERCAVGNNTATLVIDFDGAITMVICPDYEYASGTCAQKRRHGADSGPLTDFIDRVSSRKATNKSCQCIYSPS